MPRRTRAARGAPSPPSPPTQFGPKAVAQAKALLDGKGATFIEYKGVSHGFAVRGGAHTVDARAKCAGDVVSFFAEALA